jgi:hypothetical protein
MLKLLIGIGGAGLLLVMVLLVKPRISEEEVGGTYDSEHLDLVVPLEPGWRRVGSLDSREALTASEVAKTLPPGRAVWTTPPAGELLVLRRSTFHHGESWSDPESVLLVVHGVLSPAASGEPLDRFALAQAVAALAKGGFDLGDCRPESTRVLCRGTLHHRGRSRPALAYVAKGPKGVVLGAMADRSGDPTSKLQAVLAAIRPRTR